MDRDERGLSREHPSSILKDIEKSSWVILGVLSSSTYIVVSFPFAIGVFLSGALALGNFICMEVYFERIFRRNGFHPKWWEHIIYGLRFIILLGSIACLIGWGHIPVLAIILGISAPLMGILSFAVLSLTKGDSAAKA